MVAAKNVGEQKIVQIFLTVELPQRTKPKSSFGLDIFGALSSRISLVFCNALCDKRRLTKNKGRLLQIYKGKHTQEGENLDRKELVK